MATNTTNYNLIKPTGDEFYDIEVFNQNADTIDGALKSISDNANTKTNKAVTGNLTLTASKWTELSAAIGDYKYTYTAAVSSITATDILNGSVSLDTEEIAQDCGLAQYSETSKNSVTFYAKDLPSSNITINYNYIQGV